MKFILTIFLICSFELLQAQEQRTVIDGTSNKPIPYTTIKVLHQPKGVIAGENGTFNLTIEPEDSVLFTCVGYKSVIEIGKNIRSVIYLYPTIKALDLVTVYSRTILNTLVLGYDTTKFQKNMNWGPGGKMEFAQRIDVPDTNLIYKLKKIFFRIKKHGCYGPLLFHIYTSDTVTHKPGEAILTMPVSITNSNVKKTKATIDISNANIILENNKSFFIGFSWLPEAANQQCLTTIYFLPVNNANTFVRTVMNNNYNWSQFHWGKDETGKPIRAGTFFSVEVDILSPL